MKTTIPAIVLALVLVLSACAPAPTPAPAATPDLSALETQAVQRAFSQLTAGAPTALPPPPGPTPDPALPVQVVPTPEAGQPAGVALYNTAIMSGPGTDYVLGGTLLGGASVQVLGISPDGQWWSISVPPAPLGQGWVNGGYLTTTNTGSVPVIVPPPVPPSTEMVPPGPSDPQATALANVYVRSGPGTNYPAYGVAPLGATGRVIGVSEDRAWWVVRVDPTLIGAGYAWVMAQYTQASNTQDVPTIEDPDTATPIVPVVPPAGVPTGTATDYLNVRTGPSTYYPILGVAPPGATSEITGRSSDGAWWQVKVPTQYSASGLGWVSAGYVIAQNAEDVPVVTAPPPPPTVVPTPSAPPQLTCSLLSQTPANETQFSADQPFTASWTVENTGNVEWTNYDVQFVGALNNVRLHTGADVYDLEYFPDPGQTYTFSTPMMAPFSAGRYGEEWQIVGEGGVACQFSVYITVP